MIEQPDETRPIQEYFKQPPTNATDTAELLISQLGITTEMGRLALHEMLVSAQLLDRKHKDYGPGNIGKFGLTGVIVRLSDKIERLANLLKRGDLSKASTEFESVEDSLRDAANYGIIGILCLKGLWR